MGGGVEARYSYALALSDLRSECTAESSLISLLRCEPMVLVTAIFASLTEMMLVGLLTIQLYQVRARACNPTATSIVEHAISDLNRFDDKRALECAKIRVSHAQRRQTADDKSVQVGANLLCAIKVA